VQTSAAVTIRRSPRSQTYSPSSSGSDKTVAAHIPGGADMLLVINNEAVVTAAKTTYFLLIAACRALRRRHDENWLGRELMRR